jgi:ribosome biogenesis protein Nip4
VILASIKNGVTKYSSIFVNCKKVNIGKFREHVNKLEDMNLITIDSSESWFTRNSNPSIILKKDGVEFVEENIKQVQEQWDILLRDSHDI